MFKTKQILSLGFFVTSFFAFGLFLTSNADAAALPDGAPTGIATTTVGTTSIGLSWTDNASDENAFYIEVSPDGLSYVATSTAIAADAVAATFPGLTANTEYWFRILATNGIATSTYNTIGAGTWTLTGTPNAPAVVTSTATTNLKITLGADTSAASYLVIDTTNSKFLQTDGTWSSTTSTGWMAYAQLGGGSATTTTGLTANTNHAIKVLARNGAGVETAYSSTVSSYTLAATPNAPSAVASTAATTLNITLGADNGATAYLVNDSLTGKFLQTSGAWGAVNTTGTGWMFYAQLGGGSATTTTGLTANTNHTIRILGRNGDLTETVYGGSLSAYTQSSAPSGLTASLSGTPIYLSWSGDSTQYYAENVTAGTNSGWISATNYSFSSFTCGTSYTFKVKGKNASDVETAYSSDVTITSPSCSGSAGGGVSYTTPATPAVPATPATPAVPATKTTPATPAVPATPATPAVPATPSVTLVESQTTSIFSNPESKVEVVNLLKTNFQANEPVKFNYQFKNEGEKTTTFKVLRQIIDSNGRVVKTYRATTSLKSNGLFKGLINQSLTGLKLGEYTMKIQILDAKNNVLEENSFTFQVEKVKQKTFVLGAEMPSATDIAFDAATWGKIKSNVVLPANFKFNYSYANSSNKKQTVKITRELVGPNDKVVSKQSGKWTLEAGKKDSLTATQPVAGNLAVGNYTVKITAADWTTGAVLAQNQFGFAVELK